MSNYTDYLKDTVRKKQAHKSRVDNILDALAGKKNSRCFISKALLYINNTDYEEASIRRSNEENCGYILCDNDIKVTSKVSTKLDLRNKKIYNIEMRKRFCSDWCYAAYKHIYHQLDNQISWASELVKTIQFTFYDPNGKGCPGDLIFTEENESHGRLLDTKNIHQTIKTNIKKSSEDIEREAKCEQIQTVIKQFDNILQSGVLQSNKPKKTIDEIIKKINESQNRNKDRKLIYLNEIISDENIPKTKNNSESRSLISRVITSVLSWLTNESKSFLTKPLQIKNIGVKVEREIELYSYLQPLDHQHQSIIRKCILKRRIRSCGSKILNSLQISLPEFFSILQLFWTTCRLTSKNILFSSCEVKILTLVLVNLLKTKLSIKNSDSECIDLPEVVIKECKLADLDFFMSEITLLNDKIKSMPAVEVDKSQQESDCYNKLDWKDFSDLSIG